MITKAIAELIIHKAKEDNLRNFANIVLNHLIDKYKYDDDSINNALEIIGGITNGYTENYIDINKVISYVKTHGYKAENVEKCAIKYIDNFLLTVNVEYVYDVENNYITNIDIPIHEVEKTNEC